MQRRDFLTGAAAMAASMSKPSWADFLEGDDPVASTAPAAKSEPAKPDPFALNAKGGRVMLDELRNTSAEASRVFQKRFLRGYDGKLDQDSDYRNAFRRFTTTMPRVPVNDFRAQMVAASAMGPLLAWVDGAMLIDENRKAGGGVVVPPNSVIKMGTTGYCLDSQLPAPRDQGLRLVPADQVIRPDLMPYTKKLVKFVEQANKKGISISSADVQGLVWGLRGIQAAGQLPSPLNPRQRAILDAIEPGLASKIESMRPSVSGSSSAAEPIARLLNNFFDPTVRLVKSTGRLVDTTVRAISGQPIDLSSADSVGNAMDAVVSAGHRLPPSSGPAYSMLGDGLAASASGVLNGLSADIKLANQSGEVKPFDMSNYVLQADAPSQRVLPVFSRPKLSFDWPILNALGNDIWHYCETQDGTYKKAREFLRFFEPSLLLAGEMVGGSVWLTRGLKGIPFIGNVLNLSELVSGKNLITGADLSPLDRAFALIGTVPGYGTAVSLYGSSAAKIFGNQVIEKMAAAGKLKDAIEPVSKAYDIMNWDSVGMLAKDMRLEERVTVAVQDVYAQFRSVA